MPIRNIPFPDKPAEFWFDDLLLPVTPYKFGISNNNMNESDQLVDGTPVTIPKRDKAQTFNLEFMMPFAWENYKDPSWSFPDSKINRLKDLTDYLWQLKVDKTPFVLTVIYPNGFSLNGYFLLDDYSYTQSATEGSSYTFSLTMTEYYPAENYEVNIELQNTLIRHKLRDPRKVS